VKYNLLIVEDHELTRYGLKTAFETTDYVNQIFEASSAEDALKIIKNKDVHIIIMDLGLPGMNGIEGIRAVKKINQLAKIIVLTSHSDEDEVISSLQAGANSYCSKDIKPKKLTEVVQSTIEGASWFDPKVSNVVLGLVNEQAKKSVSKLPEKDYKLTAREKQVLRLMTDGAQNQEMAKQLFITVNTVKAHVCSILQKLEVEDRTQAVIKALKDNII